VTSLTRTDRALCGIYLGVAAVALVATWWNNIAFFRGEDNGGLVGFVQAAFANHAAASLTNDLLLLAVAVFVLMVVEARRLGIPHVWAYLVLSVVVAISVAFPLFLIARQRALAGRRPSNALL
jgi:hypothetical protein